MKWLTWTLDDIDPERVILFLQQLEEERGNAVTTRNVRLAAVHAFFRFVATKHPDRLEQCHFATLWTLTNGATLCQIDKDLEISMGYVSNEYSALNANEIDESAKQEL